MKTKRVISLILALVTVCSLLTVSAVGVSAATNSRMMMSISSKPCSANLSTSELPDVEVPKQGDTFYINFACTSDLKMSRAQIYVKEPGAANFTCIKDYKPSGYFRWTNVAYQFNKEGTYTIGMFLTKTDGTNVAGDMSFEVEKNEESNKDQKIQIPWSKSKTSSTRSSDNKFTINGYEIVPGSIHATYYKNGTQSTSGNAYYCKYNDKLTYVAGAQCLNYAYYCQLLLFGSDSHTTVLQDNEKDDGVSNFYGVRYKKKLSASEYKELLEHTGEGTHLRCLYNSKTEHSIFVLKVEDEGFYYTDANTSTSTYGANNIKLGYTTYEDFASGNYSYLKYVEYYHG